MPDLIKRLKMYRMRSKVEIDDETDKWAVGIMLANGEVEAKVKAQATDLCGRFPIYPTL